jgi:predicted phosphodiesterase
MYIKEGLEEMVEKNYKTMKTAIIIPDMHVPYHDEKSFNLVLKYIKDKKPNIVIQQGDMYDCYGVSRFDKDPKRIDTLQEEIDLGKELWKRIKQASPKASLYMVGGNHEQRIPKMLMRHSPGMYSLKALHPERLFELDELGIKYIPPEKTFYLNKNLVVTHGANDDGCRMSQHAGYSAKATSDKWGDISGIMGHTHRLGSNTRALASGKQVTWVENGCLCNLNPDYVKNPNWQQGFSTIYFDKERFQIVPTIIVDHEFIADGKTYK